MMVLQLWGSSKTPAERSPTVAPTAPPRTPTVALARELRRLGLGQGTDFRVAGHYVRGERRFTYADLLNAHARQVVADNADAMEAALAAGPFPFTVSVRYFDTPRPWPTVSNGLGERVRDEHPAAEPAAVEAPAVDYREEYRQEQQAKALRWSSRHAQAMAWAAAGRLVHDVTGTPRLVNAAGQPGRRVAAALLPPLVAAGFLVAGPAGIEPTEDGHRALLVWQRQRPEPVERPRKKEGMPLRPLAGGREARRRAAALAVEEERRRVEREAWYAVAELRWAVEAREERLNEVWGRVQGFTYRLGRKRPAGWVPTPEEAYLHSLSADVLDELHADAARAAGALGRAEEIPADAAGLRPQHRPAARVRVSRRSSPQAGAHDTPPCNLTLHCDVATMCV